MATSIISSTNQNHSLNRQHYQDRQKNRSAYCSIQWRQGQLLVKQPGQLKQPLLASLENKEYLIKCLKNSPVNLVRIDPALGETKLQLWADACEQATKPMYLYVPSTGGQEKSGSFIWQKFRRVTEWLTALILSILLAPIMLGIMAFLRLNSQQPFFELKWHIGRRGRLFRIFKFRTHITDTLMPENELMGYQASSNKLVSLEEWITKYGLENLPQIFNVLRGDMSLFGSRSLTLEEAARLTPGQQYKLNRLPGIISSLEVESEPSLLHLDSQTS